MRLVFNHILLQIALLILFTCCIITTSNAQATDSVETESDSIPVYSVEGIDPLRVNNAFKNNGMDTVVLNRINKLPLVSLQQMLKGAASGVFIQEPSGEPGVDQNIFINGLNGPLLSKKELYNQQPVVYINGIPLQNEHPFAYEIQKYDINRIGTATNNLAIFNTENIESIEVIKDPAKLAVLGPLAANGAIWVITKNARPGTSQISVNLHSGIVTVPSITPVNAAHELNFRRPFYNSFGSSATAQSIPNFLRDSTNADYYGPANWFESYYNRVLTYGADASLTGGSERANFRLFLSGMRDANAADRTNLKKYNAAFYVTVLPVKWLNFQTMINYTRLDRKRNRSITDRVAEQRYVPDLTNPLTPNKNLYDLYLDEFVKAIDVNTNSSLQTSFSATAKVKQFTICSMFGLNYGEASREAFWPTTILEGNNFVSNYYGINQRIILKNTIAYDFNLGSDHQLNVALNQSFNTDMQRYKYAYAYNGPNDFIKINLFARNGTTNTYTAYYFPNKTEQAISSVFGNIDYTWKKALHLYGVIRRDGSSTMQPNNRWFTSYAGGASYDVSKQANLQKVSLTLHAGYGKFARPFTDDRYSTGPMYTSYLGWQSEPALGTYLGLPGISRPYSTGWVGYNIPWSYFNKLNAGFNISALDNKIALGTTFYMRKDKEGLVLMPVPSEWGYIGEMKSGLNVNNTGVDVNLNADILPKVYQLKWNLYANISFNKNSLAGLPDGRQSIVIGNTKLEVGKPVDAYWVYENQGVYNETAEIPVDPATGRRLTFQGLSLNAGDPKWVDQNGDFNIDEDDKVLKGHYMPTKYGGFGSVFNYKKLSVDFNFYFALGRDALNQYASNRLNFANTDNGGDINAVKEITYWEQKEDLSGYPILNPWSDVIAYRADQDLFVQNASFLKLRALTISYQLVSKNFLTKLRSCNVYATGLNLLTFSKFKGDDPELLQYNGIYTGRAMPLPRSFTLGIKMDL